MAQSLRTLCALPKDQVQVTAPVSGLMELQHLRELGPLISPSTGFCPAQMHRYTAGTWVLLGPRSSVVAQAAGSGLDKIPSGDRIGRGLKCFLGKVKPSPLTSRKDRGLQHTEVGTVVCDSYRCKLE